jgi:hypothetical protein
MLEEGVGTSDNDPPRKEKKEGREGGKRERGD